MNITFDEALEEYFKYSKLKLKSTTIQEQFRKINKHILPYFRGTKYTKSILKILFLGKNILKILIINIIINHIYIIH